MKKKILVLFMLISIVFAAACGDTSDVKVDLGTSEKFTEEDLKAAAECVKHEFRNFDGCTMINLRYDESVTNKMSGDWQDQYDTTAEIAIFLSDFDVDASGGDGGFEPDSTYTDWQWILARDGGSGKWKVLTSGYC